MGPFALPPSRVAKLLLVAVHRTALRTAEWDETQHPRDEQGRWTLGPESGEKVFKTREDIEEHKGWYGDPVRWAWKEGKGRGMVQGEPIEKKDLPDTLYHVTVAGPAIESSGELRGQRNDAGLGGGQDDGVSFTTSKSDADVIQRELKRAVEIARGEKGVDHLLQFAAEDEKAAGLPPGALTTAANEARRHWDVHIDHEFEGRKTYDTEDKRRNLAKEAFQTYLMYRDSVGKNSGKDDILKNPILFSDVKKLAKMDPTHVRILAVPTANIPEKALVTTGSDKFLHEARVYANVPVRGTRALGGPGSGNYGHAGRPGEIGGSGPGDAGEKSKGTIFNIDEQKLHPAIEKTILGREGRLKAMVEHFAKSVPGDFTVILNSAVEPDTHVPYLKAVMLGDNNVNIVDTYRNVDGELEVHHDLLKLPSAMQGEGIGKNLLRAELEQYEKLGVDKVKLFANIDVGGYAWAKYGYTLDEDSASYFHSMIQGRLENIGADQAVKDLVKDVIDKRTKDGKLDGKVIWDIADLKQGDHKLGAEILLGDDIGWEGELDLHDPETMARVRKYIG